MLTAHALCKPAKQDPNAKHLASHAQNLFKKSQCTRHPLRRRPFLQRIARARRELARRGRGGAVGAGLVALGGGDVVEAEAFEDALDLGLLDGLADEEVHAGLDALAFVELVGEGGEGDDGGREARLADQLGALAAVEAGHLDVHEDEVEGGAGVDAFLDLLEGFFPVARDDHVDDFF